MNWLKTSTILLLTIFCLFPFSGKAQTASGIREFKAMPLETPGKEAIEELLVQISFDAVEEYSILVLHVAEFEGAPPELSITYRLTQKDNAWFLSDGKDNFPVKAGQAALVLPVKDQRREPYSAFTLEAYNTAGTDMETFQYTAGF